MESVVKSSVAGRTVGFAAARQGSQEAHTPCWRGAAWPHGGANGALAPDRQTARPGAPFAPHVTLTPRGGRRCGVWCGVSWTRGARDGVRSAEAYTVDAQGPQPLGKRKRRRSIGCQSMPEEHPPCQRAGERGPRPHQASQPSAAEPPNGKRQDLITLDLTQTDVRSEHVSGDIIWKGEGESVYRPMERWGYTVRTDPHEDWEEGTRVANRKGPQVRGEDLPPPKRREERKTNPGKQSPHSVPYSTLGTSTPSVQRRLHLCIQSSETKSPAKRILLMPKSGQHSEKHKSAPGPSGADIPISLPMIVSR
nr:hypothetical protein Iba_chr08eCG5930 [Ipomoea batatas]